MSCGTRIEGRFHSFSERQDLVEKLENDGEYNLALKVKHDECLNYYDLRRVEDSLERQGLSRNWDYREEQCRCSTEEEY